MYIPERLNLLMPNVTEMDFSKQWSGQVAENTASDNDQNFIIIKHL